MTFHSIVIPCQKRNVEMYRGALVLDVSPPDPVCMTRKECVMCMARGEEIFSSGSHYRTGGGGVFESEKEVLF